MKTRLLVSAVIVAILSTFVVLNTNYEVSAKPSGYNFIIVLNGPGSLSTNALVTVTHVTSGKSYIADYSDPGIYLTEVPEEGSYNVTVCTNYPSNGQQNNIPWNSYADINLNVGACTPVHE
jgi:hypothetical protein